MRFISGIVIFFFVIIIIAHSNDKNSSQYSASAKTNDNPSDADPDNTLNDIMKNSQFLEQHPDFPEITRTLIVSHGYECPRLAILWPKGQSPFGVKLKHFAAH